MMIANVRGVFTDLSGKAQYDPVQPTLTQLLASTHINREDFGLAWKCSA